MFAFSLISLCSIHAVALWKGNFSRCPVPVHFHIPENCQQILLREHSMCHSWYDDPIHSSLSFTVVVSVEFFYGSSCTHGFVHAGEGVMQSVSMMWPRAEVYGVAYCGYAHAQRPNFEYGDGSGIINGDWELLTESGSASGVWFSPSD
jgi:hypothetical protein